MLLQSSTRIYKQHRLEQKEWNQTANNGRWGQPTGGLRNAMMMGVDLINF